MRNLRGWPNRFTQRRLVASALVAVLVVSALALAEDGVAAAPLPAKQGVTLRARFAPAYALRLPDGRSADVFANGIARIYSRDRRQMETRMLPAADFSFDGAKPGTLPNKDAITMFLARESPLARPFVENRVIVVFRDGGAPADDVTDVTPSALVALLHARGTHGSSPVPHYTGDAATNRALAALGTDRITRLFRSVGRSMLSSMSYRAASALGHPVLNIGNAYRLHVTGTPVLDAVNALRALPAVAYASPDWKVSTMQSASMPLRPELLVRARSQNDALRGEVSRQSGGPAAAVLPTNYAVSASAQSMLNAPGVDALAAYAEIETKFHQLPGQGETITNVSIGDLTDQSIFDNQYDACSSYENAYGPTTIVRGGQRYIDWPSLPLIPTYTSDGSGNLSGNGEVCGNDPSLGEVGLDFTTMAPLPHQLQRAGRQGSGFTDMLGIAPGANYRLVVPNDAPATFTDIAGALLAAALQLPKTNVITASLGYGYDAYGFSGRYLEDDPLTESLVGTIVNAYGIVVCISANDGVRTYTNAAIGPDGGSTPTVSVPNSVPVSNLSDLFFSSVPSEDLDSGSIDVGGTTLDDIFAGPPQYATDLRAVAQHAYAETRWTGFTNFSSGDGSRVNVSAPSDNIVAFSHPDGGDAIAVAVSLDGGTSAAAPETAASAAIALQVARLSGHALEPSQVRALLAKTGSAVFKVPQSDVSPSVGNQIDVRRAVESLLSSSGGSPSVARVAVEQRRNEGNLDGVFVSDTDPAAISFNDSLDQQRNQIAWITIAPDWQWLPAGANYELYVTGHPQKLLASTPWARLLPKTILAAIGLQVPSSSVARTVHLTYDALVGRRRIASVPVSLTFGPADPTHYGMLAPRVQAVVTGNAFPVTYDLHQLRGVRSPMLVVSEPGRMSPATGSVFRPAYSVPLNAIDGTVDVPVSALRGGGIYGVAIVYDSVRKLYSDPAFTRVVTTATSATAPVAPLLSRNGSVPGHYLEMPYGSAFQVSYDVSNVPGATGARLEISSPGPGAYGNYNDFNNPGGSDCDRNGTDSGSIACVGIAGTRGTLAYTGTGVHLAPGLWNVVRVIPMKGTVAAGEAGEVSTIRMDGVLPPTGGALDGFGINKNGTDGFLTGSSYTASGTIVTLAETFNQTTNALERYDYNNISTNSYSVLYSPGNPGVFSGDVSPISNETLSSNVTTYGVLQNSETQQNVFPMAEPPDIDFVLAAAANPATGIAAELGFDGATPNNDFVAYTSNLLAPQSASPNGPLVDISAAFPTQGYPEVYAIGENTSTGVAVLAENDLFGAACTAPTIVNVDFAAQKVSSFAGIGAGEPYGIAIDSTRNRAYVPTACDSGLTTYALSTKSGSEVFLPTSSALAGGFSLGSYPEVDVRNGKILVAQSLPPDLYVNNNALSRVLVYDESGTLLETKSEFNLFLGLDAPANHDLQVTNHGQHAYLLTAAGLVPFDY